MKAMTFTAVVAAAVCCSPAGLGAQDIEKLSRSDVWQVRYGVITEIKVATPEARTTLERLAQDEHHSVARQAFGVYSHLFVDVDKKIARQAFERGDFDLVGVCFRDGRKAFATVEFWLDDLARADEGSNQARAVRALGLLDDATVLPRLKTLRQGTNPYLLANLAVACRRLGSDEDYLATLETLLALPVDENIYYQTLAIDYLLQTHPDKARPAWERVEKERARFPDLQAGWVYSHIAQQDRLP